MAKSVSYTITTDASGVRRGAQDAMTSMSGIEAAANRVGSGLSAMGGRGQSSLGMISGSLNQVGAGFSPIGGAINVVSSTVDQLSARLKGASQEGYNLKNSLAIGAGVSAGIFGVGLALQQLASHGQRAEADLTAALTDSGKSLEDYEGKVHSVAEEYQRYGIQEQDTIAGFAQLTAASHDPEKALADLDFALNISKGKHVDYGVAIDAVAKSYAGNFKSLRSLGIAIDATGQEATVAEAALKKLATANEHLTVSVKALSDFQARAAEQRAAAVQAATDRVANANQQATDSDQRLADVQQRNAEQTAARVQQAADAVNAARESELSSAERLSDLQARLADKQKPSIANQQQLRDAQQAVTKAQLELATGSGSLRDRTDRLAQAQQNLTDLQARQAEQMRLSLSDQQELRHATEDLTKAKENTADADAKAAAAAAQTSDEARNVRDALQGQARAHADLEDAQAKAAGAGRATLAQQQEEARLRAAVKDATDKAGQAAKDAAVKVHEAATAETKDVEARRKVEADYGSRAEAEANTLGGKLDWIKTKFHDWGETIGAVAGGPLIAIGAVGLGISGLGTIVGVVAGMFGAETIAADGAAISTGAVGAASLVAAPEVAAMGLAGGEAAGGLVAVGAAGGVAGAGLLAVLWPVALVIAAVAAITIAGYELYTHWDTVKEKLGQAWDWISNKAIEFKNFVIEKVTDVVNFFTSIPSRIWDALKGGGESLLAVGKNLIIGLWNGISSMGGWLWDLVTSFVYDHTVGLVEDILHINSPSLVFHDIGIGIVEGLGNGITAGTPLATGAIDKMTGKLMGRPIAMLHSNAYTAAQPTAIGSPGAAGIGGPGAGGRDVHLHFHDGAIQIQAGHVGTADSLVDQVHEGLQRKLRQSGDLGLTSS